MHREVVDLDIATRNLSSYIGEKGIALTAIAEKTGISYNKLYASLSSRGSRDMRADEFLLTCGFLEVNPIKFQSTA